MQINTNSVVYRYYVTQFPSDTFCVKSYNILPEIDANHPACGRLVQPLILNGIGCDAALHAEVEREKGAVIVIGHGWNANSTSEDFVWEGTAHEFMRYWRGA